jgi:hypothetical protein
VRFTAPFLKETQMAKGNTAPKKNVKKPKKAKAKK